MRKLFRIKESKRQPKLNLNKNHDEFEYPTSESEETENLVVKSSSDSDFSNSSDEEGNKSARDPQSSFNSLKSKANFVRDDADIQEYKRRKLEK